MIDNHGIYYRSSVEEVGLIRSQGVQKLLLPMALRMGGFTALYLVSTINQHDEWMMKIDGGHRSLIDRHECASHASEMSRMLKTASRWRGEFQVAIAANSPLPSSFAVRFELNRFFNIAEP